jgi:hypothetical protein
MNFIVFLTIHLNKNLKKMRNIIFFRNRKFKNFDQHLNNYIALE